MNEIIIPEDLTQEEKVILAIFSMRQFLMIFPLGLLSVAFLILGNLPFVSGVVDFGLRFLVFLVINGLSIPLAFIRLDRREQYLSEYIITKVKFMRSQKIYHG
ncbi:PrgI family mobile element protein [Peribacillus asahii]|uniref:PrgI family mobile element protein n=1 Tax=Peribacillus asahii TaxID=228899 RepID=UPI0020799674|nr:PrgI family protein [Peribacillus asahii]USK62191.1 PrgI family protein [Peribacillus asahii]